MLYGLNFNNNNNDNNNTTNKTQFIKRSNMARVTARCCTMFAARTLETISRRTRNAFDVLYK